MRHETSIPTVLSFWFDETEPKQWFIKDADFDDQIKTRFEPLIKRALAGQLDSWSETARRQSGLDHPAGSNDTEYLSQQSHELCR
jgi:uncharacterized protein (DUF924 family)